MVKRKLTVDIVSPKIVKKQKRSPRLSPKVKKSKQKSKTKKSRRRSAKSKKVKRKVSSPTGEVRSRRDSDNLDLLKLLEQGVEELPYSDTFIEGWWPGKGDVSPKRSSSDKDLEDLTLWIEQGFEEQGFEEQKSERQSPIPFDVSPLSDDFRDIEYVSMSDEELDEFASLIEKDFEEKKSLSKFISPTYQEPNVPFWSKYKGIQYNKIGSMCFSYIINKYKNRYNGCLTEPLELLINDYSKDKEKIEINPHEGFQRSFSKCVNNKSDFIIIPYVVNAKSNLGVSGGHQCLIIINTVLKCIEFFDPNGSDDHLLVYGDNDYKTLSEYFLVYFKGYDILPFYKSCPMFNFQAYESDSIKKELDLKGYCVIWSWFLADLRLENLDRPAVDIQNEYLYDLEEKYGAYLPDYLRKFIVRYGNYVFSKVSPKTPPSIVRFEDSLFDI